MRLVAEVLYNKGSNKTIDIIKGNISNIDIFTSKFEDEKELKAKLEDFVYEKISSATIRKVYILDENEDIIRILYSDYSFFLEKDRRQDVYRYLKCMDIEDLYPYFLLKSEYDMDFETLCKFIEECSYKTSSRYNALFHELFYKKYESLRNIMLDILPKDTVKSFKVEKENLTIYDERIMHQFLRKVILEKPTKNLVEQPKNKKSIFDEDSYDYSSKVELDKESYAYNIMSNNYLSQEEKIIELEMIFDDPEELREYMK